MALSGPDDRGTLLADWRGHLSWQPTEWASAEHTKQATRLLHQASVLILIGTDVAYPSTATATATKLLWQTLTAGDPSR